MSKYHSKKTVVDGIAFDSKKEARRYCVLKVLEEEGEISGLKCQVEFLLIPEQREPDTIGPRGGKKRGKIIEKKCSYFADFVYVDNRNPGRLVVEDTKGMRTATYNIKRKLMLERHGIRIREV